MKIGIDLDNTLIDYQPVLQELINDFGVASGETGFAEMKKAIFDQGGNALWTEIQGHMYGPRIDHARLFDDSLKTIDLWLKVHEVVVISHKTKYSAIGNFPLRTWATSFLKKTHKLFRDELVPVYFCDTLDEKVEMIHKQKTDVFVDDLAKVFNHPSFPCNTWPIFFGNNSTVNRKHSCVGDWRVLSQMNLLDFYAAI